VGLVARTARKRFGPLVSVSALAGCAAVEGTRGRYGPCKHLSAARLCPVAAPKPPNHQTWTLEKAHMLGPGARTALSAGPWWPFCRPSATHCCCLLHLSANATHEASIMLASWIYRLHYATANATWIPEPRSYRPINHRRLWEGVIRLLCILLVLFLQAVAIQTPLATASWLAGIC